MSRRVGIVLVSFGLLLAVGTAALVFMLLRQQQTRAIELARSEVQAVAQPVATMELPVAARPLIPGTVLTNEDVLMKQFPLDLVPVAAITSTILLENQLIVEPIGQGETFSNRQLFGDEAGSLSQQIPTGKVIFAYPISDFLAQLDLIVDGDRIDLLLTLPIPVEETQAAADDAQAAPVAQAASELATFVTLQNVEVFRVLREASDEEGAPLGPPRSLLLVLDPTDAVMLKHVKDSGGVIDFVLRSVVDNEPFELPAIDRDELFERYVRP